MLTAVEGIYENGQIILKEKPAVKQRVKVFVTFTDEVAEEEKKSMARPSTQLRGAWKDADKREIQSYFDNIRNEWERDI
ncbi:MULTISPECIES: hypothetical protein [Dyadobacter]|uniref:DUF104 domain-containing protein n=1 Tax=Dyadobacter chenhuakuii TaxID=2909339 RepID=A0ABY4XGK2_9BACT|nr:MULTISPECIES: hypothetical protein [Dyadobacter]MCF2495332.1 hypothetical protein [Dyadobacter chenhuakuii]MCF2516086.1 hypothetical protein [Dyadobacter sp. CY351]USJ29371.1 hypothetical protein NFI80_15965 [Dyadobacter chenhuakuii]